MSTLIVSDSVKPAVATLHLTQILVSYEDAVRLLRIRDTYDWHQRVWQAFGGHDGQPRDFLVRVDRKEEAYRVLILSRSVPAKPDWCPIDCFGTKEIPDKFLQHHRYRFSLLANPTKKVRSNKAGERTKNGRRVPVTQREELIGWLQRKAGTGGFAINADSLRTIPRGREFFHKDGASHGTHSAVEFQGELTVTDPAQFRARSPPGSAPPRPLALDCWSWLRSQPLINRSYSSCGPIQNHLTVPSASIPTAR